MAEPSIKKKYKKPVAYSGGFTREPRDYARFLEANDVSPEIQQKLMGTSPRKTTASSGSKPANPNIGYTADVGQGGTGAGSRDFAISQMRTQPATGDKWDGWAGDTFVPGERDLLFSNPQLITEAYLGQGPYKNNPQMAGDLARYANAFFGDADTAGIYEILTAGSLNPQAVGDDDMINALADLLAEQTKVGGRSPSFEGMLQLLYEGLQNPDSTMGAALAGQSGNDASTGQAVNALMQYIPALTEFTGNRRYADALYKQAQRVAQEYMGRQVTGDNKQGFVDYFMQNYLR